MDYVKHCLGQGIQESRMVQVNFLKLSSTNLLGPALNTLIQPWHISWVINHFFHLKLELEKSIRDFTKDFTSKHKIQAVYITFTFVDMSRNI